MEEIEKIDQIELLRKAFETFNEATVKLQNSYNQLQEEAERLRKEIEKKNVELKEKTELLDAVMMNATSAIIVTDNYNNIILKNNSATILLESSSKAFQEKLLGIKNPSVSVIEENEKYYNVSLGKFTLSDKNGYIYIIDDITNIKEIEKEQRRNENLKLMGEMAAGIAHDIRNPLGSIEIFATLLRRDLEGDREKENLLNSIIKGVKTINNTISNILLFTKDIRLNKKYVYIADIVDDVILFMKHLMNDKKIVFQNRIGDNDQIYCDIELIKQVVMNIIHNAIDAVPQGGKITIYSEETSTSSSIFIEDNGPGISPDFIDKIFLPFHSKKAKGTGLGLSIVYKIIKAHNGNIYPISKPGQTIFKITLPKEVN
ncbi:MULTISPECIES: sensor histidine kinase [Calditerrivibrio]|jgi:two-component system sensor histidine kinase FlrB|uniref:histidine kinase n=1 Tax=Calditerrivibrio nitroreducens TaxID=477976 RepID=A0A2J6WPC5_9BACT|nr:MAG: two-component sensor histidine kinase [Calditerrivibrio nitroreducens]